jgi:hypothetical protein
MKYICQRIIAAQVLGKRSTTTNNLRQQLRIQSDRVTRYTLIVFMHGTELNHLDYPEVLHVADGTAFFDALDTFL